MKRSWKESKNVETFIIFYSPDAKFLYHGSDKDHEANPKEQLQKTFREIKSINYQLLRIVTTQDTNLHQIIPIKKPFDIEVLENSPMFFKI